jgi:hypothetical protein
MPSITKSLYLNARADPRLAWFRVHTPGDFEPPSEVIRARMEEGIRVGQLARELRPGGVVVGRGSRDEVAAETAGLLTAGVPIYEAALEGGGMFCRVDILAPLGSGWELIEVKSGASVSERYRWDLAFQVAAARAAGLRVERAVLLHVDTDYVRGEELDAAGLFKEAELTHELGPELEALPGELAAIREAVAGPRPRVTLLEALQSGGDWPRSVRPDLPAHHVTELYWSNGQDWLRRGIEDIRDIPDPGALTRAQRIQLETIRSGLPYVEREPLEEWVQGLRHPLYHLDFETVSPAVPLFPGTRPYQQIPFQFSLYIEHDEGGGAREAVELKHEEEGVTHEEGRAKHEEGRAKHEEEGVAHEEGEVTHEEGRAKHEEEEVTHEEGRAKHQDEDVAHEDGRPMHQEGRATHDDGRVTHVAYLHDDLSDPRPPLIRALRAIQGTGSITAHHAQFERRVLRQLLEFSPGERWLADAADRLVDTLTPFQRFWYHHPAQRGSCSLKAVVPALTGLGYEGMEVSDGAGAGVAFTRMVRGEVAGEERERLRTALERYCELDTRGMMEVVGVLREAAGRA